MLGIPSTVLSGLSSIALFQGRDALQQAVTRTPAINAIAGIVVTLFILWRHLGVVRAYLAAMVVWTALAVIIERSSITLMGSTLTAVGVGVCTIGVSGYFPRGPMNRIPITPGLVAARVGITGGVVGAAILVSHLAGPVWGGIFSVFPAVTTATIVVVAPRHGPEAIGSIAPAWFFGIACNSLFCVALALANPTWGPALAIPIAFAASVAAAGALHKWVTHRLR